MESLRMQLQREEEKCAAKAAEVERMRTEAAEMGEDMAGCRRKEAELLEFTQKLTDKNVTLLSDLTTLEARSSALEVEHSRLAGQVGELETGASQTSVELSEERKKRIVETELLAKKLAEKSRVAEVQRQKALDAENEVAVLKRKNAATLRELTRELQSCKKRMDQQQLQQQQRQNSGGMLLSQECGSPGRYSSRASSNQSLNRSEDQSSSSQHQPAVALLMNSLTVINNNGDAFNGSRSPTLDFSVS
jgi:hypothetical protein